MLQDLGSWGSNLLGQASTQLGPAAAAATNFASSGLDKGAEFLKKGTKAVKASLKEGVNTASFVGQTYTIDDPQRRSSRRVTEVAFLAEGAFGAVMRVTDNASGEEFALKKIRCQDGVQVASSHEAAEREARILTSLAPHPNIIRCFGFSIDKHGGGSSTVKVLMELCSGGHLLDFMDRRDGRLTAKEVLETFAQITSAVNFLHSQSPPIQHRDLKVENVLQGSNGKWKLCDFGSCSTVTVPARELSRPELLNLQEEIDKTVTMLYRPPEMADIELNFRKGYTICSQVDIWMLGCILYTLSFYRHPFQDNATAMAITNAKYFIPSEHKMAQSKKLCGLIHWLLAADPKDRPTTAKILEFLPGIGAVKYEDMLASLPVAVREKIRKLDIYSARRDTGDLELPSDLSSAVAAAGAIARSGPGPAQTLRRANTTPGPVSEPPRAASGAGQGAGDFDLAFALAPSVSSSAPAPAEALHRGTSAPAVASAATDLLSLNTPPLQPAQAAPLPAAASGDLGDLLDLCAPTAAAPPQGAHATLPIEHRSLPDWSADFGGFAAAPAPGPFMGSPMTGSVSSASVHATGYPTSTASSPPLAGGSPLRSAGGGGSPWAQDTATSNQFGSFGSSPTAASPMPSSAPYGTPAPSPPPAANGAFCDFADFASALAPPVQASSPPPAAAVAPVNGAGGAPVPVTGNLLDF